MEILTSDLEGLPRIAESLWRISKEKKKPVICLTGDLGAGKTALSGALLKIWGYPGNVSSPTFSLVNEYSGAEGTAYHFDLYRIKKLDEILDIGMEEYLYSKSLCLIEWPEIITEILPDDLCIQVKISLLANGERKFEISA